MNDTSMQDATAPTDGPRNFNSVIVNGIKEGKPIGDLPYMGTQDRSTSYEPNTPCA